MKEGSKKKIFHGLSLALLACSICFAVFYFGWEVLHRVIQALKDVGLSAAYWVTEFLGFRGVITPTVNEIPSNAVEILPFDPKVFQYKMRMVGRLLFTKNHWIWYFRKIEIKVLLAALFISNWTLVGLAIFLISKFRKKKAVHNFNQDTRLLKIYKKVEEWTWGNVKKFFRAYRAFLRENKNYIRLFCVIWAYNLNVGTIIIEAIAYVIYFTKSFDLLHSYTQIAKLAMDLMVAIEFLPWPVWLCLGVWVFQFFRKKIGRARLRMCEAYDREFLEEHPGALYITGKQRSKKTSAMTDMARSQELMYRERALKGLLKREKQFPYFPWINVTLLYRSGQKLHSLPTLASIRQFIQTLRYHFYQDKKRPYPENVKKAVLRHYRRKYGYKWADFIFEYDYKRYGLKYNDSLTMVDIFDAIEGNIQQLFIYAAPTPLLFSNYPIRTDIIWEDHGNFPVYDGDFFSRKPEDIKRISKFSHIGIADSMRLGTLVDENNPYKDGMEAGIWVDTEFAKNRGNQITNQMIKADSDECNAKNDGYEINIKIKGQEATIDNYDYFRALYDDQRPGSLGADNRDLCDIIMIKGRSKDKVVLPFSVIEEVIGLLSNAFYDKQYKEMKKWRGDNTLPGYLLKKVFCPIFHYCERIENEFTTYTVNLKIWDGMTEEEEKKSKKYIIIKKKTYAGVFATDLLKPFYTKKVLRSKVGLNDYPCFADRVMTDEEMKKTGNLLFIRLMKWQAQQEERRKKKEGKNSRRA